MIKAKIYTRLLVIVFFIFLVLPGFMMISKPAETISKVEKRKLAQFPKTELTMASVGKFPEEFEEYFQDQFGLRDFYVTLYNSVFTRLFKTSPNRNVIWGREGWLYLATSGIFSDFLGQHITEDQTTQEYVYELGDRQMWLNDRGIQYLYVPVPNKIQVYPEYLPKTYAGFAGTTVYGRLLENVRRSQENIHILDLLPHLQKAKSQQQIYYKTDTHWNYTGSYLGYRQIIQYIRRWFPDQSPISPDNLTSYRQTYPGDLAGLLHLENKLTEQAEYIQVKNSCRGTAIHQVDWPGTSAPDKSRPILKAECTDRDLTVFILHDSFGNHPGRYFAQQFRHTYFFPGRYFRDIVPLLKSITPDLIIDLHAARNIPRSMKAHRDVTRETIRKRFHQAPFTLLNLDGQHFSSRVSSSRNISFDVREPDGTFRALNNDPQFLIEIPPGSSRGRILNVKINSPAKTRAQLFFAGGKSNSFSEEHSYILKVQENDNDLYVRLPDSRELTMIRFDPGQVEGQYRISGLSIRSQFP